MPINILKRPRRNRKSGAIRSLISENQVVTNDLIMPLFVLEGENKKEEIPSMPGIFRHSPDLIIEECKELYSLGIQGIVLFPVLSEDKKDPIASESYNDNGLYQNTIRSIKKHVPQICVITDVAMDPYNSDGHDGLLSDTGEILNDKTLDILCQMAISQAKAGADVISPSDMMDGRVQAIRKDLDRNGYTEVSILSYSAKYASNYYGPFREALDSAPLSGDKKTYQMDPANSKEAVREILLDIEEGADIVMVKPGLAYLDVLQKVSEISTVPVAVFNVSGEYSSVKAASEKGWLNYQKVVLENLTAFKRAGADIILTYHAKEIAKWFLSGHDIITKNKTSRQPSR